MVKGVFKFSRQYVTPWSLVFSKHFIRMCWLHLLGELASLSKTPITGYQTARSYNPKGILNQDVAILICILATPGSNRSRDTEVRCVPRSIQLHAGTVNLATTASLYRVSQRNGRFLSVKKIKSIGYHDTVTFIGKCIL